MLSNGNHCKRPKTRIPRTPHDWKPFWCVNTHWATLKLDGPSDHHCLSTVSPAKWLLTLPRVVPPLPLQMRTWLISSEGVVRTVQGQRERERKRISRSSPPKKRNYDGRQNLAGCGTPDATELRE
ncbi:hypothetical protein CEXT_478181 [Caerostris extrusa]|uniref:Uncharacterized protein n=1 Tax=Caerostris extrusa TaxID=172846 RepID=A0AAV4XSN5_CAEEX|nr:hypothetical protein CEXT_478181 [Caerostris extrusa]